MAERSAFTLGRLHWGDLLVIALYYTASIGIGIYTMCKTKNNLNSFFLAGRSLTWWSIGMSLFASNIGSINFVGIAGSGAASGLAVVMFEWSAVFCLLALAWLFLPVYISSGIYTIPEYLHKRFGGQRLRVYLSFIALLTYIFGILSVDLYSGALFIQHTVGLNIYIGVAIILGTTFLFTTLGGLMTVVLTDAFAVVVMVSGGFLLFILGIMRVGGFSELQRKYMAAIPNNTLDVNSTCGYPRDDAFHIFRDSLHADFPGLGTILRTTLGSMWFWCSNQLIVQRSLAAKNIVHAKAGSLLACYLKLTPMLIMVVPGMISRALFPEEVACGSGDACEQVCGNRAGCSNIAYPKLVTELLPPGLRGLVIAAMLAAVISSATSIFNSSSSIVTIDIWGRFRPKAKQREQMIVAKLCLLILMALAIAWIPTMQNAEGGQIYRYAQATIGLFGGPTCGLFLVAVLTEKVNETGAFWAMVIGQVWGLLRFVLDVVFPAPACGDVDTRPRVLTYWHVYYHVVSQIAMTVLFALVISALTPSSRLSRRELAGMTFWTRYSKRRHSECNNEDGYQEDDDDAKDFELHDKNNDKHLCDDNEETDNNTLCVPQESPEKYYAQQQTDRDKKQIDATSSHQKQTRKSSSKCSPRLLFSSLCTGNEERFSEGSGDARLLSLKESTFWTVFLNVNAAVVACITVGLYVYFR